MTQEYSLNAAPCRYVVLLRIGLYSNPAVVRCIQFLLLIHLRVIYQINL